MVGQRIGKLVGGALLVQSVFVSPVAASANETVPVLVGAVFALFWPSVVQARTNAGSVTLLTVTFSRVATGLYLLSCQL